MKSLFNTILAVSVFAGTVGFVVLSADNADAKAKQSIVMSKTASGHQTPDHGGDRPSNEPVSPHYGGNGGGSGCGGGGNDDPTPPYFEEPSNGGGGSYYDDPGNSGGGGYVLF